MSDRTMAIDEFINYIEAERRYSAGTVQNYRRDCELFVEYLGVTPESFDPCTVTVDMVREWVASLTKRRLKPASVNRKISSIRSLFRYLHSRGITPTNPTRTVGNIKNPSKLPVYIHENRMRQITDRLLDQGSEGDFAAERDALIVLLFYASGIRLAELVGLDVDSFDGDYESMHVLGKGEKERVIPVVEVIRKDIKTYIENRGRNICIYDKKALFLTEKGTRISRGEVERVVKSTLTKLGVQGKCSPHVLRHTFATHLLNNGADMREIQELMGHASLRATQVYTHNSITQLKAVYNKAHPRGCVAESKEKSAGKVPPKEP